MKKIYFNLNHAKKLIPIHGNTTVVIDTDGDVEVINCKGTVHNGPRKVILASTRHGELYRSPMGVNRSVRITLPAEQCSLSEVKHQVEVLFDQYLINNV